MSPWGKEFLWRAPIDVWGCFHDYNVLNTVANGDRVIRVYLATLLNMSR
jgi:hypothetical protein